MVPGPVSIRTVAARAGVSIATVSNVLNSRAKVGPDLTSRVRSAVEELGYVADGAASRLRSGKQALAGVVVPDLRNPFFASFVSTLEQAARRDGFDLLVVSCDNDPACEAERLQALRSWRPAGLIVIPCDGALGARLPKGPALPVVVADRIAGDPFDLVAVDNREAAGSMVRHLAGEGVRTCTVAGSTLDLGNVRERWEGARAAAGPGLRLAMLECGLDASASRRTLEHHLSGPHRPDAVFALDTVTTTLAFKTLSALGPAMARMTALAGFDDAEWMSLVTPGITAVCQPVDAMAEAAWAQLARRLAGDLSPPAALRLPCGLQIRGSTLRCRGRPDNVAA